MARQVRSVQHNLAYQDAAYRAKPAPQPEQKLRQVQTAGKRQAGIQFRHLLYMTFVIIIAWVVISSQMKMNTLTYQISQKQTTLEELENEYVSLKTRQERALSLTEIEAYAQQQLGMVKMNSNQIEYIEINNPDQIEVGQSSTSIRDAFSRLSSSFSAILEYLE